MFYYVCWWFVVFVCLRCLRLVLVGGLFGLTFCVLVFGVCCVVCWGGCWFEFGG